MSELPNPVNFDAACAVVTRDTVGEMILHGPDPEPYIEAVKARLDAGFGRISIIPAGDDVDATIDFWLDEVRPALQAA